MRNREVILCPPLCGPTSCCPKLTIEGESIKIEDDYGDTALISIADIEKLSKDVDELISSSRSSLDNKG
jgi:hypothetical protein